MPRQARKKSNTGIYHVMLKGIDDRNLFLEEGDRKKFLTQLFQAQKKSGFQLLAYCLMDNHIHLLMEEMEDLGTVMKRITVGYVLWHNHQYGRAGHLFQNRYRSEPVENDTSLVAVARYIHQNPIKAGMTKKADNYTWSSYRQYLEAYHGKSTHLSTDRIMGYFQSKKQFEIFMNQQNEEKYLGFEVAGKMTDSQLLVLIQQEYQRSPSELGTDKCRELIRDLYQQKRGSIRQLARVFGVSKGVVEGAVK
ncbi:REP element-mobilizing transposase RayT [Tindallia magadiensis]|uniref:REP element-mobilizing transposase RayT n=1 Tax=Tindallia magadiensis TaxID=69895 RepID=A0A1I3GSI4_9FIRM|nr:transposase [Tindallia magadiensis]SFI26407.1 REP element-mobilizing transposase RayT [Tindallia magadiensis]